MAKKKKKKAGPQPPRHNTAASGRPQRVATPPACPPRGFGRWPCPSRLGGYPQPQYGGVPGQDAFQNLPKRRPPNHLPGAVPEEELPRAGSQPSPPQTRAQSRRPVPKEAASQEEPPKPARKRRPKKEVNPARRRRNRRLIAAAAVLVLVVAGLVFSLGVLFKIERFSLQGKAPYTQEEILEVFGQKPGDNIFSFSAAGAANKIETELPYIEEVNIRRRLPGTVVLRITPATEAYCMPWEGGWAILSEKRKVLRLDTAQPEGLTVLFGVTGVSAEPGSPLAAGEAGNGFPYSYEEYLAMVAPPPEPEPPPEALPPEGETAAEGEAAPPAETGEAPAEAQPVEETAVLEEGEPAPEAALAEDGAETPPAEGEAPPPDETQNAPAEPPPLTDLNLLGSFLDQLAASGLENISWVDVSDPLSLRFCWEDRITVELGARSSLPEKLKFAAVLLTDTEKSQITAGDRGVLSLAGYPDSTNRAWFTPA